MDQPDTQLTTKFSFIEEVAVPISIKFENLNYSVKEKRSKFKQIIDGISGQFSSGDLTAILGASGSGKTTLLNILSGYIKNNVEGTIKINETAYNVNLLRKLSAYIMQSDLLQPYLTAEEQMMIVAKLKLANELKEKQLIINNIVDMFNLRSCYRTRVENLSGGERKRLSIALELISNPPVIFLDEPTSGLDSYTVDVCMGIFKQLARAGRTVICTIHQPSVPIMNQFDQIYFLSKGLCVYNGSTDNILPFLTTLDLTCPITYGYSEFVIETVETNPEAVPLLSNAIENGRINHRQLDGSKQQAVQNSTTEQLGSKFHPSLWTQFVIILHRMMLQQWRNKAGLLIQLYTHSLIAVACGITFFGIGCNAKTLISNPYFTWACMIACVYSSFITRIIHFPFEMAIVRREYLNQWYSLKAYYLALSIRSLPVKVILDTGLISASYLLSDQPHEFDRFLRFTLVLLLVSIVSDGYGLAISCTLGAESGVVLAPFFIAPLAIIALYGFGFGASIGVTIKLLMRSSFMRFAYIASMYALMDDRPPLHCFEFFCYYKDPKHLLRDLGILNYSYYFEILGLLGYLFLFQIVAYFMLKYRMREELSGKNSDYIAQLLQIKH